MSEPVVVLDGTQASAPGSERRGAGGRQRRTLFVGFAAGAVVVVLASGAAACIPWRGEVTVTPWDKTNNVADTSNGRAGTSVHGGDGANAVGGMVWCDSGAYAQPYHSAKAYINDTVRVQVNAVSGCTSTALTDDNYWFGWVNDGFKKGALEADDDLWTDGHRFQDCMTRLITDEEWDDPADILVLSGGSGQHDITLSGNVKVSANKTVGGLCLNRDSSTEEGNMVPVDILG